MYCKLKLLLILNLILFAFATHYPPTLEQSEASTFSQILNKRPHSDYDMTPSPEWIKYQQERFRDQNVHTLNTKIQIAEVAETNVTQEKIEIKPTAKIDAAANVTVKIETSSRHFEANVNHQHDDNNNDDDNDGVTVADDDEAHEAQASSTTSSYIPSVNNGLQIPSFKGLLQFIKSVQQTWIKDSIYKIEDKIKLLYNLKTSLVRTIEKQFKILWQDDDDDEEDDDEDGRTDSNENRNLKRQKRGLFDESNINFPPGAALMAINFLTFAVFLIKLVLQIVNIIKTKQYNMTTMNTTDMDTVIGKSG